jgi:DNA-binding IclR family transcriptional regulator
VLLAHLAPEERDRLLAQPLERATPATIVDTNALISQLQEIKVRGYAQTLEELEEGLNAVAAPVRQADGAVGSALSVSGPAFRMRPVDLPRLARLTVEAANALSRRLGYVDRGRSVSG